MPAPRRPSLLRPAALASLLAVGSALGAGPVAAGPAGHSGHYGVHAFIDNMEYGGIQCIGDADNDVDRVKVRRPIVFAYDKTSSVDRQTVGWRWRLQRRLSGEPDYTDIYTSDIKRRSARDDRNAAFRPRVHDVIQVEGASYRVFTTITWYAANGTTVTGQALHEALYYEVVRPSGVSLVSGPCADLPPVVATAPATAWPNVPADHLGAYGIHTLIDPPEYPAITCVYDGVANLTKLRIRRPIVFAYDSSGAIDEQWVRWRFIVLGAGGGGKYAVRFTSPTRGANATDRQNAWLLPRTWKVSGPPDDRYQVRYRIEWITGGSPTGEVTHQAQRYAVNGSYLQYCPN